MNAVILTIPLGHQLLQTCLSIATIVSHSNPTTCFSRVGTEAREHQQIPVSVCALPLNFCSSNPSKLTWCSCYCHSWRGGGGRQHVLTMRLYWVYQSQQGGTGPVNGNLGHAMCLSSPRDLRWIQPNNIPREQQSHAKLLGVLASESVWYHLDWFWWLQQSQSKFGFQKVRK